MSKNRETGTQIQWILGMKLLCVDHDCESGVYASERELLIAKAHPLQWCELCQKGLK
jgi:hypothetical protein